MQPLSRGEILDGRYRVDAILGSGGMASVFRATHVTLGQTVAVKVACPLLLSIEGMAARFLREARAATRLRNPHVAKVFDVGTTPADVPYMVMEYLEGDDLRAVLSAHGPLPPEVAVDYVLQACEALAEVHALGMVHRDLKPANLFLTTGPDGRACIKVIDFGISRTATAGSETGRLTNPQAIIGTPRYMAPEQMRDAASADARADIWSLGTVLYELLTGELPFQGGGLHELLISATETDPHPPSTLRTDLPPALDEVVLQCLRAEPEGRPRDVVVLAEMLAAFGDERAEAQASDVSLVHAAARARTGDDARDRAPKERSQGASSRSRPSLRARRRRRRALSMTVVATFVAASAAAAWASLGAVTVDRSSSTRATAAVVVPDLTGISEPRTRHVPSASSPDDSVFDRALSPLTVSPVLAPIEPPQVVSMPTVESMAPQPSPVVAPLDEHKIFEERK